MDNIVTTSRRCFGGAKKARQSDFSSENHEKCEKRARGKYFLDAKNSESSAVFRGRNIFRAKNKNGRERAAQPARKAFSLGRRGQARRGRPALAAGMGWNRVSGPVLSARLQATRPEAGFHHETRATPLRPAGRPVHVLNSRSRCAPAGHPGFVRAGRPANEIQARRCLLLQARCLSRVLAAQNTGK